ncbi:PDR/VanB family oxidoreductase [Pollutimonas thiosulfatoxidans]|uniref:Oxidoreductase n=1 Tax=Pollutimonas thiosulfatoxidans TaxID=2028345 RepID=A0A410GFF0_9BURK|nr:PDR/VanB family oxidoreductase [Pollutimonas thiosulfatoxidans]QAA95021.1 oxidoreductase [Pollutimonas thiosulfatoxidans]
MADLLLNIVDIQAVAPAIRSLTLASANGQPLPPFSAGAHLKVNIPGLTEPRCYSLVCLDNDLASFDTPQQYRLGVRLEDPSTGGSRYMHGLQVGDTLQVQGPRNDFALHQAQADEAAIVLIAGGIGITPIASMAAALKHQGRAFHLHYYGRSKSQMGFIEALAMQHGTHLSLHADDDPATHLPLAQLLDRHKPQQHLYVCGPKGLIDAVLQEARSREWPQDHLHFELFVNATPQLGDRAFEIELRQSGQVLQVPADKTILEVLEEAGCDPLFDCRRGECGVCQVAVLAGTPDHRDYYLSDDERAANDVMQICISRSHSDRLVLDL